MLAIYSKDCIAVIPGDNSKLMSFAWNDGKLLECQEVGAPASLHREFRWALRHQGLGVLKTQIYGSVLRSSALNIH